MRYSVLGILIITLATSVVRGAVVGDIVRVGYPSVGGLVEGRDMIRTGSWVPVVVELNVEGPNAFDGWIRISQPDKDGDLCYDKQRVQLLPDSGSRTYTLYVTANPPSQRRNAFEVEVLDGDNKRVQVKSGNDVAWTLTPNQPPEALSADSFLILSLSSRTAGKVALIQSPDAAESFARAVRIAHIAPKDLPSQWLGLDVVDAVVWDEAEPAALQPSQLNALLEWTRQGGLLLVAAGKTADAVARTKALASVLPVTIGAVETRTNFPRLRRRLLGIPSDDGDSYASPIPVATCTLRRDATVVLSETPEREEREQQRFTPIERDDDAERSGPPIITRGRVGRGRVVFVAASLHDLFSEGGDAVRFFRRTLELRDGEETTGGQEERLFAHIDSWVGFSQTGALYLVSAMALAAGYVLIATAGSWQFLKSRGDLKHSWSAFALVSIVATLLTVIGVQAVRGGVGKKLMQLSVVDADAGDRSARATAYFGLKTSMFDLFDVWAPGDYPQVVTPAPSNCTLKPLPSTDVFGTNSTFVDPGRYRLGPSRAEMVGVPIRGTVKQFESRWNGSMPGMLRANLNAVYGDGGSYDLRIDGTSTITNDLGVDLYHCFLIYAAQDVYLVENAIENVDRSKRVYILPIPSMAAGESVRPGAMFYEDGSVPRTYDDWNLGERHDVDKFLQGCGNSFRRLVDTFGRHEMLVDLQPQEISLLMTSMLAEYVPDRENTATARMSWVPTFTSDGFRHLDISHFIDTRTALFIGFSDAAGPVTLCTGGGGEYRAIEPTRAMTMYRILIPLNREGLESTGATKQP